MRDLYSNFQAAVALSPDVYAATVNGAGVDVSQSSGAVFVANVGAIVGAGAFSAKLQESADGATGWADVAASRVKSNAPAVLETGKSYRLGYLGKLPFVRLVATKASGTSAALSAVAILRPFNRPVA